MTIPDARTSNVEGAGIVSGSHEVLHRLAESFANLVERQHSIVGRSWESLPTVVPSDKQALFADAFIAVCETPYPEHVAHLRPELREFLSLALSLQCTWAEALRVCEDILTKADAGQGARNRAKKAKEQACGLLKTNRALTAFGALQAAHAWKPGTRAGMPTRRPRIDGLDELGEVIWHSRMQFDFPSPPPFPTSGGVDDGAIYALAAADWSETALRLFLAQAPKVTQVPEVRGYVLRTLTDLADAHKLFNTFDRNIQNFEDAAMSPFGRFVHVFYMALRSTFLAEEFESIRTTTYASFPHISPAQLDYVRH